MFLWLDVPSGNRKGYLARPIKHKGGHIVGTFFLSAEVKLESALEICATLNCTLYIVEEEYIHENQQ
jgi:hypothetical protein